MCDMIFGFIGFGVMGEFMVGCFFDYGFLVVSLVN